MINVSACEHLIGIYNYRERQRGRYLLFSPKIKGIHFCLKRTGQYSLLEEKCRGRKNRERYFKKKLYIYLYMWSSEKLLKKKTTIRELFL